MDEILVEIETDKVVLEVPAPAAGVLFAQIVKNDGATMCVAEAGHRAHRHRWQGRRRQRLWKCVRCRRAVNRAPAAAASAACGFEQQVRHRDAIGCEDHGRQQAVPAGSVPGTGKDGRVTKGDVLGDAGCAGTQAAKAPAAPWHPLRRQRPGPHRCCRQVAAPRWQCPCPTSATAQNSACRCRACAPASPSGWCSRSPPTPSSRPSTK